MAGGSCLLGSINLAEFVLNPFTEDATFDWFALENTIMVAIDSLNDVLDEGMELHPLQIQRDNARDWRQIGLGVMGIADMLIKLGIQYGSADAIELCGNIADMMITTAIAESSELAKQHGSFPKFDFKSWVKSEFVKENVPTELIEKVKDFGLRNSQILTIAPTGSISNLLGISGGIEPLFATSYERKTESLHGTDVYYTVHPKIIVDYLANGGSLQDDVIVTAHDLNYKDRVDMQAVWQSRIDASISSTINLPSTSTVQDVRDLYLYAWRQGCKGVTVYVDGQMRSGVLSVIENDSDNDEVIKCKDCGADIKVFSGGCSICMECGWSPCS